MNEKQFEALMNYIEGQTNTSRNCISGELTFSGISKEELKKILVVSSKVGNNDQDKKV